MSTITVRLNKEEEKAFNQYAKFKDLPLSTLFKKSLEEKIEDEIDLKAIKQYENEKSQKLFSHDEVGKILGIK